MLGKKKRPEDGWIVRGQQKTEAFLSEENAVRSLRLSRLRENTTREEGPVRRQKGKVIATQSWMSLLPTVLKMRNRKTRKTDGKSNLVQAPEQFRSFEENKRWVDYIYLQRKNLTRLNILFIHTFNSTTQKAVGSWVKASLGYIMRPYLQKPRAGHGTQWLSTYLPSLWKDLEPIPYTPKKNNIYFWSTKPKGFYV